MITRKALLLLALCAGVANAQGPFSILISTGDTITAKEYYTKGDTLGLTGTARVAKNDVVLFWTKRERWTFTYPAGRMVKIKEDDSDPCVIGRVCAARFAECPIPYDSLPMPDAWKTDSAFLTCYRNALLDRGITSEENGDRVIEAGSNGFEGTGGIGVGEPNQLILRTGDTLFITKDFYGIKDTLLCWYGGRCTPTREVYLLRTIKGQFFYQHGRKGRSRLRAPLPDMSVASRARLHANMLFTSGLSWEHAEIPAQLRTDPVFLASYRTEVVRLVEEAEKRKKRNDALRVLAGGLKGGIIGAGLTGAFIKSEDRPYWGTPMPD